MSGPIVVTSDGSVEGSDRDGYQEYLGIPFAAPPVGPNRFRAPQPVTPWTNVKSAQQFGPRAPQLPGAMEISINGGPPPPTSEAECLTLNVWTPSADHERRPVMVWIHGGGFVTGAGSSPWYRGERFAVDHEVVLVSLNYRLGVLGFSYLAALGGAELAGSGSVGVQDAAAGLRWVRDNIANFGGDPANVTIFGESAGAMSVGTLLALTEAQGLFHRAILQSGAANSVHVPEKAQQFTNELLEILELPHATLAQLQELPVDTLLEAHGKLAARHAGDGLISMPVVDGTVLDIQPLDAVRAGSVRQVDLMIGTNRDEWRLFVLPNKKLMATNDEQLRASVERLFSDGPDDVIAQYRERLGDALPAMVLAAITTDHVFRIPALELAESQRAAGGAAYVYLFDWETPQAGGMLGSCHALELPFVFNTMDQPGVRQFVGDGPPRDLATAMNATWAAFARYGDPSKGTLGSWPLYDSTSRPTMVINVASQVMNDPLAEERSLWTRP